MKITGSNVIVTGGGSGIGKGLCERFASLGAANVVVSDLDLDAATSVAETIGGIARLCDVGDARSVETLVGKTIADIGHIDVFCANAGVGMGDGLHASDELWDLSWRVNVMGPVFAARQVIPHMERRGGGTFVVTVSAAGLNTGPTSFNYATSKHAALAVAEWLSINHGPTISVHAVCPTIVDTPMAPEFGDVLFEPLTVDDVVDGAIDGIENGGFLIPVGPGVIETFQAKAGDYDAFLANMQQRVQSL